MKGIAAIPKMLMSLIILGLIIVGAFLFMIKGLELLAKLNLLKQQQTTLLIARMISTDPRITDKPFVINSTKCRVFLGEIEGEINNVLSNSKLVARFMIYKSGEDLVSCQGGLEGISDLLVINVPLFVDNGTGYLDLILGESA